MENNIRQAIKFLEGQIESKQKNIDMLVEGFKQETSTSDATNIVLFLPAKIEMISRCMDEIHNLEEQNALLKGMLIK